MTRFGKKLSLNRETVRDLTPEEMARVGGGATKRCTDTTFPAPDPEPGRETLWSCNTHVGWGGTCNPCNTCFTQGG